MYISFFTVTVLLPVYLYVSYFFLLEAFFPLVSSFSLSSYPRFLFFAVTAVCISAISLSASSSSADPIADRFYRTLYASLYDTRLSTSSKQAMYLNLLFKCIKSDKNLERARAFVRRFIQVLASGGGGGAEFTAGGLHLLGEASQSLSPSREGSYFIPR